MCICMYSIHIYIHIKLTCKVRCFHRNFHSTFQHYESYPIGMKFPGECQLDFSMFSDLSVFSSRTLLSDSWVTKNIGTVCNDEHFVNVYLSFLFLLRTQCSVTWPFFEFFFDVEFDFFFGVCILDTNPLINSWWRFLSSCRLSLHLIGSHLCSSKAFYHSILIVDYWPYFLFLKSLPVVYVEVHCLLSFSSIVKSFRSSVEVLDPFGIVFV